MCRGVAVGMAVIKFVAGEEMSGESEDTLLHWPLPWDFGLNLCRHL